MGTDFTGILDSATSDFADVEGIRERKTLGCGARTSDCCCADYQLERNGESDYLSQIILSGRSFEGCSQRLGASSGAICFRLDG